MYHVVSARKEKNRLSAQGSAVRRLSPPSRPGSVGASGSRTGSPLRLRRLSARHRMGLVVNPPGRTTTSLGSPVQAPGPATADSIGS